MNYEHEHEQDKVKVKVSSTYRYCFPSACTEVEGRALCGTPRIEDLKMAELDSIGFGHSTE